MSDPKKFLGNTNLDGFDLPQDVKMKLYARQVLAGGTTPPNQPLSFNFDVGDIPNPTINEVLGGEGHGYGGAADLSSRVPMARLWTAVQVVQQDDSNDNLSTDYPDNKFPSEDKRIEAEQAGTSYVRKTDEQGRERIYERPITEVTQITKPKVYMLGNNVENTLDSKLIYSTEQQLDSTGIFPDPKMSQKNPNEFFSPPAGLTSVTINSRSITGTLASQYEAVVRFSVHNIHDFTNIYSRYILRNGATVVIDAGWDTSLLYNPDIIIDESAVKGLGRGDTMFDALYGKKGFVTTSGGDLLTIVGTVGNFSAEFRPDGSFDCSINVYGRNVGLVERSFDSSSPTDPSEGQASNESNLFVKKIHDRILQTIKGNHKNQVGNIDSLNSSKAKKYVIEDFGPTIQSPTGIVPFEKDNTPPKTKESIATTGIYINTTDPHKSLDFSNTFITVQVMEEILSEISGTGNTDSPLFKTTNEYTQVTDGLYDQQTSYQPDDTNKLHIIYPEDWGMIIGSEPPPSPITEFNFAEIDPGEESSVWDTIQSRIPSGGIKIKITSGITDNLKAKTNTVSLMGRDGRTPLYIEFVDGGNILGELQGGGEYAVREYIPGLGGKSGHFKIDYPWPEKATTDLSAFKLLDQLPGPYDIPMVRLSFTIDLALSDQSINAQQQQYAWIDENTNNSIYLHTVGNEYIGGIPNRFDIGFFDERLGEGATALLEVTVGENLLAQSGKAPQTDDPSVGRFKVKKNFETVLGGDTNTAPSLPTCEFYLWDSNGNRVDLNNLPTNISTFQLEPTTSEEYFEDLKMLHDNGYGFIDNRGRLLNAAQKLKSIFYDPKMYWWSTTDDGFFVNAQLPTCYWKKVEMSDAQRAAPDMILNIGSWRWSYDPTIEFPQKWNSSNATIQEYVSEDYENTKNYNIETDPQNNSIRRALKQLLDVAKIGTPTAERSVNLLNTVLASNPVYRDLNYNPDITDDGILVPNPGTQAYIKVAAGTITTPIPPQERTKDKHLFNTKYYDSVKDLLQEPQGKLQEDKTKMSRDGRSQVLESDMFSGQIGIPIGEIFINLNTITTLYRTSTKIPEFLGKLTDELDSYTSNNADFQLGNYPSGTYYLKDLSFPKLKKSSFDQLFIFNPHSPNSIVKNLSMNYTVTNDSLIADEVINALGGSAGGLFPLGDLVDSRITTNDWYDSQITLPENASIRYLPSTAGGIPQALKIDGVSTGYADKGAYEATFAKPADFREVMGKPESTSREVGTSNASLSNDSGVNVSAEGNDDVGTGVGSAADRNQKSNELEKYEDGIKILPIEVSFDTYGIGYNMVGGMVRLDYLPSTWLDRQVIQLLGQSHTITPGTWTTTLSGRMATHPSLLTGPGRKFNPRTGNPLSNITYVSKDDLVVDKKGIDFIGLKGWSSFTNAITQLNPIQSTQPFTTGAKFTTKIALDLFNYPLRDNFPDLTKSQIKKMLDPKQPRVFASLVNIFYNCFAQGPTIVVPSNPLDSNSEQIDIEDPSSNEIFPALGFGRYEVPFQGTPNENLERVLDAMFTLGSRGITIKANTDIEIFQYRGNGIISWFFAPRVNEQEKVLPGELLFSKFIHGIIQSNKS